MSAGPDLQAEIALTIGNLVIQTLALTRALQDAQAALAASTARTIENGDGLAEGLPGGAASVRAGS